MSSNDLTQWLLEQHDRLTAGSGQAVPTASSTDADNESIAAWAAGTHSPTEERALLVRAATDAILRRRLGEGLLEASPESAASDEQNRTEASESFPRLSPERDAVAARNDQTSRPRLLRLRPVLALAACLALGVLGWWLATGRTGPGDPWAGQLATARRMLDAGQYQEARDLAKRAEDAGRMDDDWRDVSARAQLGDALAMAETRPLALIDLGLDLSSGTTRGLGDEGEIRLNDYERIKTDLGISPEAPGQSAATLAIATRAALAARMWDDAEQFARAWAQVEPQSSRAHSAHGLVLLFKGRGEEALPEFQRALQIEPSATEMHLNAAAAALSIGRRDVAQGHWETFLSDNPNHPAARDVRKRLEALRGRP